MKYINAAEILPEKLLRELVYIPKSSMKKEWGAASGSRTFYQERNREIQKLYREGSSIDMLMKRYGLAYSTIKKIIYG